MNEGIRTEIREFLNSLESNHSVIKYNMYNSVLKIAQITKKANHKEKQNCSVCGNECSSNVCSVCKMITRLTKDDPNSNITSNQSMNGSR